jgi:site-specific DNA-methyltransferase (adenine-specific)
MKIGNGEWLTGDCFDLMAKLPDASIDMVLCDLPYGTTQNKWDSVLPLDQLWAEYWRVCSGAVVLTAAQPFTSALVMSQPDKFKYDWSWGKSAATGHLNAKRQPMRNHEDVLVFGSPIYRPQGLQPHGKITRRGSNGSNFGESGTENYQEFTNYPRTRIEFPHEGRAVHPTQKPVALFEYLIRTYTNEGDTVLDNTAGSGTTAIAAENAGRKWICIERDEGYSVKAIERIQKHARLL